MNKKALYAGVIFILVSIIVFLVITNGVMVREDGKEKEAEGNQVNTGDVQKTKPVKYDFLPQQTLRYRVNYTVNVKDEDGAYREDYSIDGVLEVTVISVQADGDYLIDISTSLISARSRREQKPIVVDKNKLVKIRGSLGPKGKLDFEEKNLDHVFKPGMLGEAHARIFRAVLVVFPPLPKEWTGSAITGGTYSYSCLAPVVIRGEQKAGPKDEGIDMEVVSHFSEGVITSGCRKYWKYSNGKPVTYCNMSASLIPEYNISQHELINRVSQSKQSP